MRRGISIYAATMIAAILIGYTIFESKKYIEGALLLALLIVLNFLLYKYEMICAKRLLISFLFIIIGLLIYANSFISFERDNEFFYEGIDKYQGKITEITEIEEDVYKIKIKPKGYNYVLGYKYGHIEDKYQLIGCNCRVIGKVSMPSSSRNPMCFDYRLYLKSINVTRLQNIKSIEVLDDASNIYELKRKILIKRDEFIELYDDNPLVKGILFGDKTGLDDDIYQEFRINGIAHILAVSGLHIGILYGIFILIISGSRKKVYGILFIAILLTYGTMTMFSPSCTRAISIIIISLFAYYFNYRFDMMIALSFLVIIFTLMNPYILFNIGFKMSFIAVIGICFYSRIINKYLGSFIGTIISAQLAIIPIIIYEFNYETMTAIIANIVIMPIVSVLVPILIVHLTEFVLLGFDLDFIVKIVSMISDLLLDINEYLGKLEFLSRDIIGIGLSLIILYYILSFMLSSEFFIVIKSRKSYKLLLSLITVALISCALISSITKNEFLDDEVILIDVGQGDGIHIRTDKKNVLIDGGGHYKKNIGATVLKPYFLKNRVSKIDLAIPTHLHMDHFKGMSELYKVFSINKVMIYKMYEETETCIDDIEYIEAGNKISIDDNVYIETLWPILTDNIYFDLKDENTVNMVMKLNYYGKTILITGDLLSAGEKAMVDYYKGTDTLKCDVLKVCHHGSNSSSTDEFLDAVDPSIAIIQVGKNNYGHPSDVVIEKLFKRDIMVFRNDEDGAIGLDIKEDEIIVDKMIKKE
ncbi:MAG: DNA internalization-related competence protein ComEC/Rec2 [Clostridiales bacterium]|nr:DNA internalization-related competence protein ComEC/Rec2 [Clostridiales bacterium]